MEQPCFSANRNGTCAAATAPVAETLLTASLALLAALVILCSGRRTSAGAACRFLASLALMLFYPTVSYTLGSRLANDNVVWACFLLACADTIFARAAVDLATQAVLLAQATQAVCVLLLALLPNATSLQPRLLILLLLPLCALSLAKLGARLRSVLSPSRDRALAADNWLVSSYMAHEYVRSVWDFDAGTMKGYRYVVTGEKDGDGGFAGYRLEVTDELVTVDRVWQQHDDDGGAMDDDDSSSRLKDLCLSFALFKLLRRRLTGDPLHERDDDRTLAFVRKGLAGGDDHERMFRVIEAELGFLSDLLYARYPSPQQSLAPETAVFLASMALGLSALFLFCSSSPAVLHNPHPQAANILLTRLVIALFLILELFHYSSALSLVYFSDWHKVKMFCRYVRKPSWILQRLLRLALMCRPSTRQHWNSNEIGQYSLLHACLRRTTGAARRSLPLPATVKRAIHRLVRSEWLSDLKYGDRTLQRHDMLHDFDWSTSRYRQYGAVGSILVWHIATTICAGAGAGCAGGSREVATTLSNYCAYLLQQAPELVTDHPYEARRLMEALQLRIRRFLAHNGCRSEGDMFDELPGFQPREAGDGGYEEDTIVADGIKLGCQISDEMPDEAARWDVLSEMWVELLLSAAPSGNVTGHVQRLATGCELVTQLWALLTHGGIVDRPKKPYYESTACADGGSDSDSDSC